MRADLQNYLERVLGVERLSTEVLVIDASRSSVRASSSVSASVSASASGNLESSAPRIWLWDCGGHLKRPSAHLLKLREMAEKLEQAIAQLVVTAPLADPAKAPQWPNPSPPHLHWCAEETDLSALASNDVIIGFGADSQASGRWGSQLRLLPSLAELFQSPALKKQAWAEIRSACASFKRT